MWFLFLALTLPDLPTEDRLMEQARRGKREAVAQIYEAYFDAVYRFIRWRVGDDSTAEDLTSEVFIRLLGALRGAQAPQQSLRGWLFRVARNVLHDHFGRAMQTDELDETLPAGAESDVLEAVLALDDAARVRRALNTLAPDQQDVLVLRFGQALSLEETAVRLDRSVSAIKSLQFRALGSLRRRLEEEVVTRDRE